MKKWMAMAAALALVGAAVPHGFAENVYTLGTYAAQAKGFGGVVSVSVTFDEKGMTDVQVEAAVWQQKNCPQQFLTRRAHRWIWYRAQPSPAKL